MYDRKRSLSLADEEVAFWQGFIEWWEAKEGRPATPRMLEALAYAESKRCLSYRRGPSLTPPGPVCKGPARRH